MEGKRVRARPVRYSPDDGKAAPSATEAYMKSVAAINEAAAHYESAYNAVTAELKAAEKMIKQKQAALDRAGETLSKVQAALKGAEDALEHEKASRAHDISEIKKRLSVLF
jgi:predicted  nucleic acid-binding Zn-ribbon protein